jgi:hypothetical protein
MSCTLLCNAGGGWLGEGGMAWYGRMMFVVLLFCFSVRFKTMRCVSMGFVSFTRPYNNARCLLNQSEE